MNELLSPSRCLCLISAIAKCAICREISTFSLSHFILSYFFSPLHSLLSRAHFTLLPLCFLSGHFFCSFLLLIHRATCPYKLDSRLRRRRRIEESDIQKERERKFLISCLFYEKGNTRNYLMYVVITSSQFKRRASVFFASLSHLAIHSRIGKSRQTE